MKQPHIHLGFEVRTGAPVLIPLHHLVVTGITQLSGKTTTLEALIRRSGLRALCFVTKRGEAGFVDFRRIRPFFRQERGWQFYEAILEAAIRERLKFERGRIMRASKGASTLKEFHRNVSKMLDKARGIDQEILTRLDEYCQIVVPQMERTVFADRLELEVGVNVMDLSAMSPEMQALVIYSCVQQVFETEEDVILVVPEANEFIPQGRGSPVKLAAARLIRKGAGIGNYVWLDTQDLAAMEKEHLKQVGIYILGVQLEDNEVRRTLAHIPKMPKPKTQEIQSLGLGEFYVCYAKTVRRVYVQPAWLADETARAVAMGDLDAIEVTVKTRHAMNFVAKGKRAQEAVSAVIAEAEDEAVWKERCEQLEQEKRHLQDEVKNQERTCSEMAVLVDKLKKDLALECSLRAQAAENQERAHREAYQAEKLAEAIRGLLGASVEVQEREMDEERLIGAVLARIGPGVRASYTLEPAKHLRKSFQQEEATRILAAAEGLTPLQQRIVKLLETTDGGFVSQPTIAQRLGRSTGGGSYLDLARAVRELAKIGFIEVKERQGAKKSLREKITADLAFYEATQEDVEEVYQRVLYEFATSEEK